MKFKQRFKFCEKMWTWMMTGGQYTKKSLNELYDEYITDPMHSNVEKTGVNSKV